MLISPWALYFILQLDSFNSALQVLTIIGFICFAFVILAGAMSTGLPGCQNECEERQWAKAKRVAYKFFWLGVITLVLNAALPSTRTMAAIVVLPAILNNENVQKEAGELYQLAKQGLANTVESIGKDDEKPKEEPEKQDK